MRSNRYTEEDLREAVKTSTSKAQVLTKLGLAPVGGNYETITRLFNEFDIDTTHFKGESWSKGRKFGPKRPISDYLENKVCIQSHKLKNRLIGEGIVEHKCQNCNKEKWFDKLIPLELHHIDGKSNSLDNLQILCPNCHALTDNYRGKNKKTKKVDNKCIDCGTKIYRSSKRCRPCQNSRNPVTIAKKLRLRKFHVEKEKLIELIRDHPMTKIGKMFGVSDNAIRNRCKTMGIDIKEIRGGIPKQRNQA